MGQKRCLIDEETGASSQDGEIPKNEVEEVER